MGKIVYLVLFVAFLYGLDLKELDRRIEEAKKRIKLYENLYEDEAKKRAKELYEYYRNKKLSEIEALKKELEKGVEVSEKRMKQITRGKEPIYVFMSSSVPETVWEAYMSYVDKKKLPAVFLLRGCIGGCTRIKPTLEFFKKLLINEDGTPRYENVEIAIDPLLFRKYNIDVVPCVVYKGKISCGDWSFDYHLRRVRYAGSG